MLRGSHPAKLDLPGADVQLCPGSRDDCLHQVVGAAGRDIKGSIAADFGKMYRRLPQHRPTRQIVQRREAPENTTGPAECFPYAPNDTVPTSDVDSRPGTQKSELPEAPSRPRRIFGATENSEPAATACIHVRAAATPDPLFKVLPRPDTSTRNDPPAGPRLSSWPRKLATAPSSCRVRRLKADMRSRSVVCKRLVRKDAWISPER